MVPHNPYHLYQTTCLKYGISIGEMLDALMHVKSHHAIPDGFKKYARLWKDNGIIQHEKPQRGRWVPGPMFTKFQSYLLEKSKSAGTMVDQKRF